MVEAVSSGAMTMVTEGAATLGQFVAPFIIMEAPYVWKDAAQIKRAVTSPLMDELNKLSVSSRNMRVIGSTYYGKRHLTTGSREVHSVADMKGFKLRVPEVDVYRAMAEAWGAKPTPLNFGELYLALSQGALDGEENPLPTIQSGKLFEVQKFLVLTGHIIRRASSSSTMRPGRRSRRMIAPSSRPRSTPRLPGRTRRSCRRKPASPRPSRRAA